VTEIIFVDNNSTDATPTLLEHLAGVDPRVTILLEKKPGISAALNLGLLAAKNDIIARIDVDDLMIFDRCEIQVKYLLENRLDVVAGDMLIFNSGGNIAGQYLTPKNNPLGRFSYSNPIFHPTVMYRRSVVLSVGGYRSEFDGAEDLDLWLRLLASARFGFLSEVLVKYRVHEGQSTASKNLFKIERRVRLRNLSSYFSQQIRKARIDYCIYYLAKIFYCYLLSMPPFLRAHRRLRQRSVPL